MTLLRMMAVTVLVSFASVALAQPGAPLAAAAASSDEAMLMKMDSDFAKATQERRLEGWMEYMADDVVLRRGQNVVGRDAVRAALAPEWANAKHMLNWSPVASHMAAGGKVGYTWGKWEGEFPDEQGNITRLTGTYITIWGKQKDGSWKVLWDGGGANPK